MSVAKTLCSVNEVLAWRCLVFQGDAWVNQQPTDNSEVEYSALLCRACASLAGKTRSNKRSMPPHETADMWTILIRQRFPSNVLVTWRGNHLISIDIYITNNLESISYLANHPHFHTSNHASAHATAA